MADFNDIEENIYQSEIVMIEEDSFIHNRQRRATMASQDRNQENVNTQHSEDIDSS